MKYTGKYKKMADNLREEGYDEPTIKELIQYEIERDNYLKMHDITELEAARVWQQIPEDVQRRILKNAYCVKCGSTTFTEKYNLRNNFLGIQVNGYCSKCGGRITRVVEISES
ncbi:hypothetical protein SAMN05421767_12227 [Granulicatella balaenopterae]|uniref:Uncharacterized protein n=1 Tax=Granulicatella balaenopterae TaxID=137733 RepID=A0A1H9LXW1_9LACT|nr:hypothetical protein [Granulicatella balaenopterae]SER16271.1 hypothetical protein SAMN05421767_12227 [Granulicatella balaenopterae]